MEQYSIADNTKKVNQEMIFLSKGLLCVFCLCAIIFSKKFLMGVESIE